MANEVKVYIRKHGINVISMSAALPADFVLNIE